MFGIRGRVKIEWILDAFNKVFIWDFNHSFYLHHDNAGINLTGYHPPLGLPEAFALKCVPSPSAFAQQKMPGPINDDVPGAAHLYQLAFKHKNRQHNYLGLKIKMSEYPIGSGKLQKTQNAI